MGQVLYAQSDMTWNGSAWSATNGWNTMANGSGTAVQTPDPTDTLEANGHTLPITGNLTAAALNCAGYGEFDCSTSGVTVTADIGLASPTSPSLILVVTLNTPNAMNIVGNCYGGTGPSAAGVKSTGTGTVNITGNCTGGSGGNNYAAALNFGGGTINITGNVTGGSQAESHGAAPGYLGGGTINVIGNVIGGSANRCFGIYNYLGSTTVTGWAKGGSAAACYGVINQDLGTCVVGVAVGNDYGNGSYGLVACPGVKNTVLAGVMRVTGVQYGALGQVPTEGQIFLEDDPTNVFRMPKYVGGALKTLSDPAASTGQAAIADVRYGTSYALGNLTGTCRVPTAAQTASGVPVDATTGTAVLTAAAAAAAILDAARSAHTGAGTFGAVSEWASAGASGLTAQETRDAMALALGGAVTPEAGSVDTLLGGILTSTGTTLETRVAAIKAILDALTETVGA